MKLIRPTAINDTNLVSSSIAETDYPAWSATTSYTVGTRVVRSTTHAVYEAMLAGVDAGLPEATPLRWVEVSPTNRWGMFDAKVGTASSAAESLTVVLTPGRINSLALLEVDAATVSVTLTVQGATVYSATMNLVSGNTVGNWYQYFYEPVYSQNALVITDLVSASLLDLPAYGDGVLTVVLARQGGTVSCGLLVAGLSAELGSTQYRPSLGIVDYSRKDVDAYGNYTIVKRKYSKTMTASVAVACARVDSVSRILAQYRSTPLVWVGAGSMFTSMIIYGFYKDWNMVIEDPVTAMLALQVEGL